MSADNWAVCPQCKVRGEHKASEMYSAATASYGKIPADEYMTALREASEFRASLDGAFETFREDYELGVSKDGEFSVSYSGGCSVCGLSHNFRASVVGRSTFLPNLSKKYLITVDSDELNKLITEARLQFKSGVSENEEE